MAYRLEKTGDQVRDDLNAVEEKTIYPKASVTDDGIMTKEHVIKLNEVDDEVSKIVTASIDTCLDIIDELI